MSENQKVFKDVAELKDAFRAMPGNFKTEMMFDTQDGRFMFVKGKFIRLDNNWVYMPQFIEVPEIGFEPTHDRCICYEVERQDQLTAGGTYIPRSQQVASGNGNTKVTKHRTRFFVAKAGETFSRMVTDGKHVFLPGDEIILADYVNALAEKPVTEDPTGYVVEKFFGVHYSEIQGYVIHNKKKGEGDMK